MTKAIREHEAGLADFVALRRRDRFRRSLAAGGKARAKELARLHDGPELEPRWVRKPTSLDRGRTCESVVSEIQALAPRTELVYVASGDPRLDGCTLDLASAVREALQSREGSLVSVVPGRVALYIGELFDDTLVLVRPE
jgi:hypothetical protein